MIICLDYFYEEDLDVNILCRALSNILTDLPYLAGRWKGYLLVGDAKRTIHLSQSTVCAFPWGLQSPLLYIPLLS